MDKEIGKKILRKPDVQSKGKRSTTKEERSTPKKEPLTSREEPSVSVEEPLASQEESSISNEKLLIPEEESSISAEEPLTSQEESSISEEKVSIPEAELSISEENPSISVEEPSTSREESSISEEKVSIPEAELSISEENPPLISSVEELLTSRNESSISEEKVSIPEADEPSISDEKPSISVEELSSTLAEKLSFLKEEPSTSSEVPAAGSSRSTKKNRENLESTLTTAFPPIEEELSEDEKIFVKALNDEYRKVKANPPIESMFPGKENKVADMKYEFGANLLKEKNHSLALIYFSKSVAYAEDGSRSQLRAYKRRAYSLYFLNAYDLCVEDVDRALRVIPAIAGKDTDPSLYPVALQLERLELEQVKLKCLKQKEMLLARGVTFGPKRILGELFLREVEPSVIAPGRADDVETEWRNLCQFDNASIPNASSKIRLGYDESKWGRYLEATQDLKAGEIVASQKCFALFVPNFILWQECCSYCLKLNQILIPCQTCPYMMYCSIECRDTAFESYHRLECKFMSMFWLAGNTTYCLIRPLLIGTEQGARLGDLMRSTSIRDLITTKRPASQTFVDDYATFLRLEKTLLPQQMIHFAPDIANVIFMLERIGFFDGDSSFLPDAEHPNTLNKAQIFTAFLLILSMAKNFKLLGLLKNDEEMRKEFIIGQCHSSLYSAFNHSCNPNIEFLLRNRELVAFALRPIKKGEELVMSYFEKGKKLTFAKRIEKLKLEFGFTCQCAFCTGGWPKDEDGYEKLELRFYDHVNPKRAKEELEILVALVEQLSETQFQKLPTTKILDYILCICEWLFTNMKPPSDLHIGIQHLVFVFTSLVYDQFNSVRSTVCPVMCAYDFLRKIVGQSRNATASEKKKPRQVIP